jgi:phage gp45-like
MLHKLIRWARITKPAPAEPQQFAVQQVSYSGKVGDAAVVMPYGLHANLPVDSLALMFAVNGEPDNRAIIGYDAKKRPALEEGEVAFYHPPTDSFIIFRASGDLDIQAGTEGGANVNIICTDANITASGDVNVEAANVNIDAGVTNLGVGGLAIARVGDAVAVDGVTHSGTITAGGLNTSI